MTKLLISKDMPDGHTLEDVFRMIRGDILERCHEMHSDSHPEIQEVLSNNMYILGLMEQIIAHAESSSEIMKRIYGKSQSQ
ncbi:hypothetical protein MTBPR1_10255 [Candidatus Terasakiella magnetica]|uniref:Uncharacterized protein n=1 Tax=Candidatus Terasakiella magnetica TaxID=1867952 RepID=A0A1C3RCN0_9PROT|nr:hypothetical protein [Candidatus Terasakiella magnetica]SCA55008.1 hypothetical protein MTBPR1_10255 [Candidatus Terasakiella magnetica]